MVTWRVLIVAVMVAMAGCATSNHSAAPPVVPPSTWQQVDRDLLGASQGATEQAEDYARDAMQHWMALVEQRTDSDFIPWFSSYWTRQWLSLKVAWYKLNAEGEKDPTVERLAAYLQEKYHERVLEPVARGIDPELIMTQATQLYVRQLAQRLQGIAQRHGVPSEQFDRRLQSIPAIALTPATAGRASLYQLVHANPLAGLPAYAALLGRIRHSPGGAGAWSSDPEISALTRHTSEQLVTELAASSVAGAVSSLVGRAAGMAVSLAAAGFSSVLRDRERPQMEAQLRQDLKAAFDQEWLEWMRNPESGVLAGVNHISGHVEDNLATRLATPVQPEPTAQALPVRAPPPLEDAQGLDDYPYQLW